MIFTLRYSRTEQARFHGREVCITLATIRIADLRIKKVYNGR